VAAAADEEVDPTELRVVEQEGVEEDEERSTEGRGGVDGGGGFRYGGAARTGRKAIAIRAAKRGDIRGGTQGIEVWPLGWLGLRRRWAWADRREDRLWARMGPSGPIASSVQGPLFF